MSPQIPLEVAAALLAGTTTAPDPALTGVAPVTRRDLLTAALPAGTTVATIRIQEITLGPHAHVPLHLHPNPVVGVVREGTVAYQREGGPVQLLHPGDAFHEPAHARVARFDNAGDGPAKFTAFYLLGPGDHELLRPLPE